MYESSNTPSRLQLALARGNPEDLAALTNAELYEGLAVLDWTIAMMEIELIRLRADLQRRREHRKEVDR